MPDETTALPPAELAAFLQWIKQNASAPGVGNWNSPDAHYDMQGFFADKPALAQWHPGDHFPDTYKQHGHDTFSMDSKYSKGFLDGGRWLPEDRFIAPETDQAAIMQALRAIR